MTTLGKAIGLLTPRERRRGALVLVMVVVMAILETAGLASIMPFLAVLGNPSLMESNEALSFAYRTLGFASHNDFLIALAVVAFVFVVLAAVFRSLTRYAIYRYTELRRHGIGVRLLQTYLGHPYTFFLNRHSSDLAKTILSEADQIVFHVYRPAFDVLAFGVVLVAIIILLLVVHPWLALGLAVALGGAYGLVYIIVRGVLGRTGQDRAAANRERFTTAGEALGAVKEIKLLGKESAYVARFMPASLRYARHQATAGTLADVPKYIVESLGVGGILALVIFLMATGDGLGSILPILGLYAFAAYRLLPAAQHIYAGLAHLRFGAAAIEAVYDDLCEKQDVLDTRAPDPPPMRPRESIELRHISFRYPNAASLALRNIDLAIPIGSSVGFVGGTGAGKTTLVDVLLGLLKPSSGVLAVDGLTIDETNVRAWQRTLGYVPQSLFLADATVAENIALGVSRDLIDHAAVERAARMAQLHEFIMERLPVQYDTEIGERGVRLSGGQRQRIAIARALYHDPAVLVFDEATSALDNQTEQAVMEAVKQLSREKTVILIAHRLSTVRDCDTLVFLKDGEISAQGTFAELAATSRDFRAMLTDRV